MLTVVTYIWIGLWQMRRSAHLNPPEGRTFQHTKTKGPHHALTQAGIVR
jgi:hypothetical protein